MDLQKGNLGIGLGLFREVKDIKRSYAKHIYNAGPM